MLGKRGLVRKQKRQYGLHEVVVGITKEVGNKSSGPNLETRPDGMALGSAAASDQLTPLPPADNTQMSGQIHNCNFDVTCHPAEAIERFLLVLNRYWMGWQKATKITKAGVVSGLMTVWPVPT